MRCESLAKKPPRHCRGGFLRFGRRLLPSLWPGKCIGVMGGSPPAHSGCIVRGTTCDAHLPSPAHRSVRNRMGRGASRMPRRRRAGAHCLRSARPVMADTADHRGGAVRGWREHRHHGSDRERAADRRAWPARHCRECRGRERRNRSDPGRPGRARWKHPAVRIGFADHHRAVGAEDPLRSPEGFCPSQHRRRRSLHPGRQGLAAGEHLPGVHRVCAEQSRQAELRVRRSGRHHPSDDRAARLSRRDPDDARPVQERGAGAQRPPNRRSRCVFRQRVRTVATGRERSRSTARGVFRGAAEATSGHADDRRVLPWLSRHLVERVFCPHRNAAADRAAVGAGDPQRGEGPCDCRSSAQARYRAERPPIRRNSQRSSASSATSTAPLRPPPASRWNSPAAALGSRLRRS